METTDVHEHVESIIKTHSQSFYKAFALLPEAKARAVFAIYAFCRTADDAIDVHRDIARIDELEKHLKATFEGNPPQDPLFQALAEAIEAFPSNIDPYLELLGGLRDDYNPTPMKTDADLDDYCYNVAGTVGVMLLPVLASKTIKKKKKKLTDVAIELGKAMQITNILRDVRDDLINDRIYFSEETMEQHKLEIEITRTGLVTPEWISMMEHYIGLAKEKYRVFYDHVDLFDHDARYPTMLAATLYEAILDKIAHKGYRNLNRRYDVGSLKKWMLARRVRKTLHKRGLDE